MKNFRFMNLFFVGTLLIPFFAIFPDYFRDKSKMSHKQFVQIYDEVLASESKRWASIEFSSPMSILEALKFIKSKNLPLIKIDFVAADNFSFEAPAALLLPLLKEINEKSEIRISHVSFSDRSDDFENKNAKLVESFKISETALNTLIAKTTDPLEKAKLVIQLEETKRSRIWLAEESIPKARTLRIKYFANPTETKK